MKAEVIYPSPLQCKPPSGVTIDTHLPDFCRLCPIRSGAGLLVNEYPVYDIQWQKVTPTRIYFRIEIEINENLPSDITAQVKSMVESVFNGGYEGIPKARIGARINAGVYYAPVISISPDYVSISSITISKDGSIFTQSVTPGIDQIPTIQQSDIEVLLV
ncbi:hypothetical protein [Yersinia frederiksenii]|uniref:hypothetical protein n=1 Tax=Yersinia frederiksenii TaxID=29484 RepID=UPI0015955940